HTGGKQRLGGAAGQGGGKTGAVAAAGIGGQRKLRHGQYRAVNPGDIQVGAAVAVGEHAVAENALCQPPCARFVVVVLGRDQRQQTVFDGGNSGAVDTDRGTADALQQRDHGSAGRV